MKSYLDRRTFMKAGGATALAGLVTGPCPAGFAMAGREQPESRRAVHYLGDGLNLDPREYVENLSELAGPGDLQPDRYSSGGIIARLESVFARLLGKESAVFLPTGTLANHLAVRRLAIRGRRVIVQADSHLYNDSGDCAQLLGGLNLVPVEGPFTPAAIRSVLERTSTLRVRNDVGAIVLESPLRRGFNSAHGIEQAAAIAALARKEGIGVHLDGARLWMLAADRGIEPAEYAAPFDTVYVSLYKNFNAAGGAVLAGSRELLDGLHHERRMFGGGICRAWPLAAVALRYVESFLEDYRRAKRVAERVMEDLDSHPACRVEKVPGGTNSFWLHVRGVDPVLLCGRLAERDIHLIRPRPGWEGLLLMINPTIARIPAEVQIRAFREALAG